ncbi:MAG: VOC family protein [Ferruginibacter sp.]
MALKLFQLSLLVPDYDDAISYYTRDLGFILIKDNFLSPDKRWVVVSPGGEAGLHILLAKAANENQKMAIGNQAGGRVFLFLHTDDFDADFARLTSAGVEFTRKPVQEAWGKVAVFKDKYGNLWDLIES